MVGWTQTLTIQNAGSGRPSPQKPQPDHRSYIDEAPEQLAAEPDGNDWIVEDHESREHPLLAVSDSRHHGQEVETEAAEEKPQQHEVAVGQGQQPDGDRNRGNREDIGWAATPQHLQDQGRLGAFSYLCWSSYGVYLYSIFVQLIDKLPAFTSSAE
jgi:hypothetical protein